MIWIHVSENRIKAIGNLNRDSNHILLLDDAFQHRKVRAGFSILVSDFNAPFFNDFILPIGNLREPRRGAKRADLVLFTKCPSEISADTKKRYTEKAAQIGLEAFFSKIALKIQRRADYRGLEFYHSRHHISSMWNCI